MAWEEVVIKTERVKESGQNCPVNRGRRTDSRIPVIKLKREPAQLKSQILYVTYKTNEFYEIFIPLLLSVGLSISLFLLLALPRLTADNYVLVQPPSIITGYGFSSLRCCYYYFKSLLTTRIIAIALV